MKFPWFTFLFFLLHLDQNKHLHNCQSHLKTSFIIIPISHLVPVACMPHPYFPSKPISPSNIPTSASIFYHKATLQFISHSAHQSYLRHGIQPTTTSLGQPTALLLSVQTSSAVRLLSLSLFPDCFHNQVHFFETTAKRIYLTIYLTIPVIVMSNLSD